MRALEGALAPLRIVAVFGAVLLLTAGLVAGAWTWPAAWVLLAVYGGLSSVASGLLAVLRPDNFRVRMNFPSPLAGEGGRAEPGRMRGRAGAAVAWFAGGF